MKFTIFTSCHNQAAYLSESIESVLNQTYTDFEYLIYDDGSTDNTWEIIQSYATKDSRIKAVKLDKQKNVACVLNRSIRDMSTDFWLWCPSDDVWCRNLLEVKAKYAAEHPDKVVYSNFTYINEKGLETGRTTIKPRTPDEFRRAAYSSPIGFTGILIPKTVLELVGPFPEHFWFSEDFYWMYKAATFDKVDFVGDSGFLYSKRIHSNRLTARRSSEDLRLQVELAIREVKALSSTQMTKKFWAKRDCKYVTDPSLDELLSDLVMHKNSINDKDILIIGVGRGGLYKELFKKARSISSLDISTEALSSVSKYGKIYTPETLHELPTESIDYAASRLVAQHMTDDDLTDQLRNVFRALKQDGRLAIHFAGDVARNDIDANFDDILRGGRCRSRQLVNKIISEAGGQVIGDQVIRQGPNWYWFTVHAKKRINGPPIPKKIFFYWGNPVMSWLRYMTLHSFRKLNPDWEMELHVSHIDIKNRYWKDDNQQDFHAYKGKNYLPEVEKLGVTIKECPVFVEGAGPSHNSNFFKWNELATGGGIYSDMDILFVKSIDGWYESIKHYSTGLSYKSTGKGYHGGYFSIGFMFSSGNNCFFKDVFNSSIKHYEPDAYQGAGVMPLYRMLENNGVGMKPYHSGLCYIPMNIVYPWEFMDQADFFNICHTTLPEETIGIHWFAGHPEAQAFNNNVNPDTLDSYNNTMSYWLKQLQ